MILCILLTAAGVANPGGSLGEDLPNARKPRTEAELRGWLENMVWYHSFSEKEIMEATGLSAPEISRFLKKFDIDEKSRPPVPKGKLLVLPYPGGRHPRIGFLDGAVKPQRETKVSVFAPWDNRSYVVADVPEAIWSNLGLTYLAHTHVPTVWTEAGVELKKLEWSRKEDGSYEMSRTLPNKIAFSTRVIPRDGGVVFEQTLTNGTRRLLQDLRVQNCMMLKGMEGFNQQTNDNKLIENPFVACSNKKRDRWVITAWSHCHRPWANERCPCMHSDPMFPSCPPGETRKIRGWLSFYEGDDIKAELNRLGKSNLF